jgi:hypothetical protein
MVGGVCARSSDSVGPSAGARAGRRSGGHWSRGAWTLGRGRHRFSGAGRSAGAPVQRGGRGMCGRTERAGGRPGPTLPASVRLGHCVGGLPSWVDAVRSCDISLHATSHTFAKEDIIDGWWKGERSHDCRVSGLLERWTWSRPSEWRLMPSVRQL